MIKICINCDILYTENYSYCQHCGSYLVTYSKQTLGDDINDR